MINQITICHSEVENDLPIIEAILIPYTLPFEKFSIARALAVHHDELILSEELSLAWQVQVFGQADWIGTHLALLRATEGKPVIPTGTRIEFTK